MSEQDRDPVSHQVDRHSGEAPPPRDYVIDPDDIDPAEGALDEGAGLVDDPDPFHRDDEPPRYGTSPDDLPESQGEDVDVADRAAEDAGARHLLSDEER
jgi:hypothetical protein